MSIGIMEISGPCNLLEIGERAAYVKKYAKSMAGNVYAWDRRQPLGSDAAPSKSQGVCLAPDAAA